MRFQQDGNYCTLWFGAGDPTFAYMRFGETSGYEVATQLMATRGGGFLRVLRDPRNLDVIGLEIEPHDPDDPGPRPATAHHERGEGGVGASGE